MTQEYKVAGRDARRLDGIEKVTGTIMTVRNVSTMRKVAAALA